MNEFTFQNINWLLLISVAPTLYLLYHVFHKSLGGLNNAVKSFADKHLLEHLIIKRSFLNNRKNQLIIWSLLWFLACIALAAPRLGYKEVEVYENSNSLVILLDLSASMNAKDLKPSRIVRAKQEIEDLLKLKTANMKIALIGFSQIAHLITPLTNDADTIINLMPAISTRLVSLEGSNLKAAMHMAQSLLKRSNSSSKTILVMSDGEFDNAPDKLESDINLSMMGFGTKIGAPVPQNNGALLRRGGEVVISKLDEDKMRHLVQNGIYVQANYLDNDVKALLKLMENNYDNAQKTQESKIRYYNEIFYIPVGLMLVIMLLLFAKRAPIFVIALLLYSNAAQANPFLNQEQNAKKAFEKQDYEAAIKGFGDNAYNKGVAQYRAGQYKQASDSFAKAVSQRLGNMDTDKEAAANASYNLGNSYFQQQQFDKAIKAYETALQQKADFDDAKHNLELAKKKLQEQEKNKDNKQDQQQQQNQQNQSQQDKQNQQQESGEQNKEEQKGEEGEENKEQDQQESEDEKQQGEEQEKEADQEEQPTPSPEEQQRDFEADKQLNRIESNPANILKNQFYIEEQQFLSKEKK